MGNAQSAGCENSSSDDSDEIPPEVDLNALMERVEVFRGAERSSEGNESSVGSELDAPMGSLSTDAMVPIRLRAASDESFMEALHKAEPHLDEYEKVALIYLLYDDAYMALQEMGLVVQNSRRNVLQDWYKLSRAKEETAKEKLLESLAIVQNYKVLKLLGHAKSDIKVRFSPRQSLTALYVDVTKKYLYRMIESFDSSQINQFGRLLKDDLRDNQIQYRDFDYLEMQLAYLDTERYISHADRRLSNLAKHLKVMELDDYHDDLTERVTSTDRDSSSQGQYDRTTVVRNAPFVPGFSDNVYHMDDDHPGLCLIIENIEFYRDPEHLDKLVNPHEVAERRDGSWEDSRRLKALFSRLRFRVRHEKNLSHERMLEVIHEVVHDRLTDQDSCFILCILSHGIEGKVIANNMVPVKVNDIKAVIAGSQKLVGKPKVLVLQSCQGKDTQKIQTDSIKDTLRTDSSGDEVVPSTADVLEIWSTIAGYASFRDINEGTWFIQTFCDVLEKHPDEHLYDQFTRLENQITRKTWEVRLESGRLEKRVMTSELRSTLTKKLYLPKPK